MVEKEGELEYCYKQILFFEPAHSNQALRKYHSKIIILFRRRCNRLKKEEGEGSLNPEALKYFLKTSQFIKYLIKY